MYRFNAIGRGCLYFRVRFVTGNVGWFSPSTKRILIKYKRFRVDLAKLLLLFWVRFIGIFLLRGLDGHALVYVHALLVWPSSPDALRCNFSTSSRQWFVSSSAFSRQDFRHILCTLVSGTDEQNCIKSADNYSWYRC